MKKCKKCGAPLEGFLYKTIGKLLGIKPSANDPELCNKCEAEVTTPEVKETVATPAPEPMTPPAAPMAETSRPEEPKVEDKDELIS